MKREQLYGSGPPGKKGKHRSTKPWSVEWVRMMGMKIATLDFEQL